MLNHILRTLGLPKRTEINTNQTPALRRIAGLEDELENLNDQQADVLAAVQHLENYVKELEKAVLQIRMILDDMQPKPVKPARKTVRGAKP